MPQADSVFVSPCQHPFAIFIPSFSLPYRAELIFKFALPGLQIQFRFDVQRFGQGDVPCFAADFDLHDVGPGVVPGSRPRPRPATDGAPAARSAWMALRTMRSTVSGLHGRRRRARQLGHAVIQHRLGRLGIVIDLIRRRLATAVEQPLEVLEQGLAEFGRVGDALVAAFQLFVGLPVGDARPSKKGCSRSWGVDSPMIQPPSVCVCTALAYSRTTSGATC